MISAYLFGFLCEMCECVHPSGWTRIILCTAFGGLSRYDRERVWKGQVLEGEKCCQGDFENTDDSESVFYVVLILQVGRHRDEEGWVNIDSFAKPPTEEALRLLEVKQAGAFQLRLNVMNDCSLNHSINGFTACSNDDMHVRM